MPETSRIKFVIELELPEDSAENFQDEIEIWLSDFWADSAQNIKIESEKVSET